MPSGLPAGVIQCSTCGTDHEYVPGTRRGQKCETCFKAMVARSAKAHREARRKVPHCIACGLKMPPRIGKGSWRERCADCHRAHLREMGRVRYYERRRVFVESAVCIDCDSPFPRTGRGGPVPKRCPPCKLAWRRNLDRSHANNRRARKLALPYETIRPLDVYARDGWACQICGDAIDPALMWPDAGSRSVDHIVPLSRGGHHVWSNVQAAHLGCNLKKAYRYESGESVA